MAFELQVDITNITNIVMLSVSYIAVDQANFNYYFNVFTEVPLNYASPLTNLSTPSGSLKYHY